MNCHDISLLLDDRDIGTLGVAERQQIQAHLDSCPACARDWQVHLRLMDSQTPSLPANLVAHCRVLVAAQSATVGVRRARSRFIVIGTLVAMAAAAGMLAVYLLHTPEQNVTAIMPAAVSIQALPAKRAVEPASQPAVVSRPVPSKQVSNTPAELAQTFTVSVVLRYATDDPVLRKAVQTQRELLLDVLRAVPGLQLLDLERIPDGADSQIDYRITLTGGDGGKPVIPGVPAAVASALVDSQAAAPSRAFQITLQVDWGKTGTAVEPGKFTSYYFGFADARCDANPDNCNGGRGMAERVVGILRAQVFPADPSLQRELQARLTDASLGFDARQSALADLVLLIRKNHGNGWNSEMMRGAVYLASTTPDPAMRMQVWRTLRGIAEPGLVKPLVDLIHQETDDSTRLEAVQTLAEYGKDPAGRAALESLASSDSRQLLREVARRALYGDAGWYEYIASTLKNPSLSDAERMEPINYLIRSAATMGAPASIAPMVDDQVMAALQELLPRTWGTSPDTMSGIGLVNLLRAVHHPGATELLLDSLQNSQDQLVRHVTLNALAERSDDPRVRTALEEVEANDPDPQMRQIATGMLQVNAAPDPKTPGATQFQLTRTPDAQAASAPSVQQ